ncbi:hypothetical protein [Nocardia altamirensis]|uniref:hypothetical protein n=1 Tax=Nocardia altamirensis TaxID=472158 RepID=UPI00350E480A
MTAAVGVGALLVAGGVVVVADDGVVVVDDAASDGFGAVLTTGTCGAALAVVVSEGPDPVLSASDVDSDIAPSPPNTMASAINTIANARNGGPPEVGFG